MRHSRRGPAAPRGPGSTPKPAAPPRRRRTGRRGRSAVRKTERVEADSTSWDKLTAVLRYGVKPMSTSADKLTIGALAAAAGVNVETIRFYQRRRLLSQPPRPQGSIRRYGTADEIGRA